MENEMKTKRTPALWTHEFGDDGEQSVGSTEAKTIAALADALEALLGWQTLAPAAVVEQARAALRAAGRG
jgi:hypothetical protein